MKRLPVALGLVVLMLLTLWPARAPRAAQEARLVPGAWLKVKGEFSDLGTFVAREVDNTDDRRASLKGPLSAVDVRAGTVQFGALTLVVDAETRLEDDQGVALALDAFAAGQRVKITLDIEGGEPVHVRRIRALAGDSTGLRIAGPFHSFLRGGQGATEFRLLGVRVHPDRGHRRRSGPAQVTDDEEFRPDDGLWIGNAARFSGEVRFDYKDKRNFDLTDALDLDLSTRRFRTELELTFPGNGRISGMAEIKAADERAVTDEGSTFEDDDDLTLGETYVHLAGVLGRFGSLQVGRARFDDERDWLFRKDLDAVRVFFDTFRLHLEVSLSQQLVDAEERQDEILNELVTLDYFPDRHHRLSAYVLRRDDDFVESDGDHRDFSPTYYGVRASGSGARWSYWFDGSVARGDMEGLPLRGEALDVGGTWVFPGRFEPSVTVGYAFGSGDDDPFDGVDRTFRQTGLQLNNGKWNGVTNFRYYGELLRPELANLRIETYGVGIRFARKSSLDLVFHRYELDEPTGQITKDAILDRRLNFMDMDVGRELDLVLGIEEFEHVEFEVDLGIFYPGGAFLGDTDVATTLRFKAKYVF